MSADFSTRVWVIWAQLANIEQNLGEMAAENRFSLDEFLRFFRLFLLLSSVRT